MSADASRRARRRSFVAGREMADLLDNPHAVLDGQVRDRAA